MYPFGRHDKSVSRKARDYLILAICALIMLNVLQFALRRSTATDDSTLRSALIAQLRADANSARTAATQLSRTGGSNTQHMLSEVRQYLYGISQVNELHETLLGKTPVSQASVQAAIGAVDACESRLLMGLAIDEPLAALWAELNSLLDAAEKL